MSSYPVLITGATGHVGFAVLVHALEAGHKVRASVRRGGQAEQLRTHEFVKPHVENLEVIIIPDILTPGAFDNALSDVKYIIHLASPLPDKVICVKALTKAGDSTDFDRSTVQPAINGTMGILRSAQKHPSVRRVIIASSLAAIVPPWHKEDNVYSATSRIEPLPKPPYATAWEAYAAAKALVLDATDRILVDEKPSFSIVNILAGYVLGANEFLTRSTDVPHGSNANVMEVVLGQQGKLMPSAVVHLYDAARIHISALDEKKVVGSKGFCVVSTPPSSYENALEIVRRKFPDEVHSGLLPLGGTMPTYAINVDTKDTIQTFGPLLGFEEQVESVVGHYLKLKKAEQG